MQVVRPHRRRRRGEKREYSFPRSSGDCVECAALVEPDAVIRAFASGMTGVAVLGLPSGRVPVQRREPCRHQRLELLKTLLDATGIGGKRLLISFGTAHEGYQYAEVVKNIL